MDAFQLLKNDHKIVSALFDQIESASGNSKSQLFARLKNELDVHAHIEEKIFYPALENKQASREITLEAYEEHKVVKDLLTELSNGSAKDDEWDAKLKVLRENVEHHVEEEEGELFDKASDVLNDETIERLGGEMEAEKARQQGLPREPTKKRGRAKTATKSASSRKQAKSPGVLARLANLVGLGEGSSRAGKKKATRTGARSAKKSGAKTATKRAAKKSGARKARKVGTKKSGSLQSASSKAPKRTTSRKAAKRGGASKQRKSGGSKRR